VGRTALSLRRFGQTESNLTGWDGTAALDLRIRVERAWGPCYAECDLKVTRYASVIGMAGMPKRTRDYHAWLVEELKNREVAANYLNEALRNSRQTFLKALRNVAEAGTITKVAKKAGVRRESLYRTLSDRGNPRLDTLNSVLGVLGLQIAIEVRPTAHQALPKR
jgi:probable addiction module antidote protein